MHNFVLATLDCWSHLHFGTSLNSGKGQFKMRSGSQPILHPAVSMWFMFLMLTSHRRTLQFKRTQHSPHCAVIMSNTGKRHLITSAFSSLAEYSVFLFHTIRYILRYYKWHPTWLHGWSLWEEENERYKMNNWEMFYWNEFPYTIPIYH